MKGLIFFLFLLAHATMVWATPLEAKEVVMDTLDNEIFETDPKIDEEENARKEKQFNAAFLIIWLHNATKLYSEFKIVLSWGL